MSSGLPKPVNTPQQRSPSPTPSNRSNGGYTDRYDNYDRNNQYDDDEAAEGDLDEEYWQYQEDMNQAQKEAARKVQQQRLPPKSRILNPLHQTPAARAAQVAAEPPMEYHARTKKDGTKSTAVVTPPDQRQGGDEEDDWDDYDDGEGEFWDGWDGEGEFWDDWDGEGEWDDWDDEDDDDQPGGYGGFSRGGPGSYGMGRTPGKPSASDAEDSDDDSF